uniref:Uncharacterized protein n=1 Tax=Arundo donax TaxID=35708 RepID=A0A0A9BBT8_ARUDO
MTKTDLHMCVRWRNFQHTCNHLQVQHNFALSMDFHPTMQPTYSL